MTEHELHIDRLIAAYLQTARPETVHQMAMEWNWDSNDHFFQFVVDNPHSDKATVLMIYWMAGPRFDKQFETKEESKEHMGSDSTFELLEKIESNFQKDFYKNARFHFDPDAEDHTGTVWAMQDLDIATKRDIPGIMFQKLEGEVLDTNDTFEEGVPPELATQIRSLD